MGKKYEIEKYCCDNYNSLNMFSIRENSGREVES